MEPASFGECCRHPPGRGNSLNVADPVTLQLIMDTLLADGHGGWAGLRFDLTPSLSGKTASARPGRRSSTWCPRTRWSPGPSWSLAGALNPRPSARDTLV